MPDTSSMYLGLISGTSADGIDAALVRFEPHCELIFGRTYAWDESLRAVSYTHLDVYKRQ